MRQLIARLRARLWVKLALFGVLGVAATHTLHLVIGRDLASRAVLQEQVARGQDVARLVARQVTDAMLVEDAVSLQEAVENAARSQNVAWCFIERDGRVFASTFTDGTPAGLVGVRPKGQAPGPLILRVGNRRYLDVGAPLLGGAAGVVRVGLDLEPLAKTRHDLGVYLGLVALATIAVGVLAALLVGRKVTRPAQALLSAAAGFDPAVGAEPVPVRGSDEFAELTVRFNEMMARLHAAHAEYQASVRKAASSERLVALGSLVAGVAHEVNNPLAGLKNVQAAFRKGELSPERHQEYVELMGDALGRIEAIVGRLLEFGRPRPLALAPLRPQDLVREISRLAGAAARQRGVTLAELDEVVGAGRVMGDRLQLGQALLNLVLNALHVTPRGGAVRLRCRERPGWLGVAVEDDGPGIPPELRDRVLDPFFTTKPEGEGTGLGLSVTRAIVDAHHGELEFAFPAAGGTTVTLWLRAGAP